MENNNNKDMPDEIWAGINISGKKWNEGDCFESPMAPPLAHAKYTRTDTIAEKDRVMLVLVDVLGKAVAALNTNQPLRPLFSNHKSMEEALAEYAKIKESE